MPDRASAGPPRGVLPGPAPRVHRRILPCAALAPVVAHFWWVQWQVEAPTPIATLPHPCVHLTIEWPGQRVTAMGVQTARFERVLRGRGAVLGVKFRPGVLQAIDAAAPRWRDRRVDCPWAAPDLDPHADLTAHIERLEAWLGAHLRPLPAPAAAIRDLVERVEHEREWLRAEQLAAQLGIALRTAQRRFRAHVGVSPKWVIRRYRLIEAADALGADPAIALTDLAMRLGYFDQSHFIRDFTALIGQTPSRYRAIAQSNANRS